MAVLQVNRLSGLYLWAALILLFGLWIPETFLTYATFQGVLAEQAVAVILALGVLVSLSAGQFDHILPCHPTRATPPLRRPGDRVERLEFQPEAGRIARHHRNISVLVTDVEAERQAEAVP